MKRRCLVIKTYGDPDMYEQVAPVFSIQDCNNEEFRNLKIEHDIRTPRMQKYYQDKIEEANYIYALREESKLQRWFEIAMATLFVIFHSCARDAEEEE